METKKNSSYGAYDPYSDPYSSYQNKQSTSASFDWIALLLNILRYWYVFVICFVVAFALAYLKNKSWTPTYKTVSTILVEANSKTGARNDFISYPSSSQSRNMNNQMIMYGSYDFITRCVENINQNNEIYAKHRFLNSILYKNAPIVFVNSTVSDKAYGLEFNIKGISDTEFQISFAGNSSIPAFTIKGTYGQPIRDSLFFLQIEKTDYFVNSKYDLFFHFFSKRQLAGDYSSRLGFRIKMEGASVLEISLIGKVPERDIDFLNLLNQKFFDENLSRKNETAEKTIEFLDSQLAIINDSIYSSETKLNDYQLHSGVYTQSKSISSNRTLDELDDRRNEIKLKKNYLKYLENYIDTKGLETLADPGSFNVTGSNQLSGLVNEHNQLVLEMKSLGTANQVYINNMERIKELRKSMKETIKTMNSSIAIEEKDISERYARAMSDLQNMPQKERRLLSYERDLKINESYYSFLQQKRTESQIQKASNAPDNLVIDNPRVQGVINGSEKANTYSLFLILGFLVPVVFVVCKEFLFKFSIQTREEVERISGLPVLGTIERSLKKTPVVVQKFPKSSFTECFRSLRSRLDYMQKNESGLLLLVTSTEPQDGKTFIAMNMASLYQLSGKKTIVVDFDLRRPALTKNLDIAINSKGLYNCLVNDSKLEDVIITHPEFGFDVLPAGDSAHSPSEIVRSESTKQLLEQLRKEYDYVIVDCSPVGLVADAHYLAKHVDVVFYVVRNEKTNRNFFRYTINELQEDSINNVVIVYNDVNTKSGYYGSRRYYGRSSYYLKHGSYYLND